MVPGQAKQFTHQAGGNVGFVWVYVGFVWVCIENTAASVERDVGKTRDVSFPFLERRWVLLKIPRCDIDGVGEGK